MVTFCSGCDDAGDRVQRFPEVLAQIAGEIVEPPEELLRLLVVGGADVEQAAAARLDDADGNLRPVAAARHRPGNERRHRLALADIASGRLVEDRGGRPLHPRQRVDHAIARDEVDELRLLQRNRQRLLDGAREQRIGGRVLEIADQHEIALVEGRTHRRRPERVAGHGEGGDRRGSGERDLAPAPAAAPADHDRGGRLRELLKILQQLPRRLLAVGGLLLQRLHQRVLERCRDAGIELARRIRLVVQDGLVQPRAPRLVEDAVPGRKLVERRARGVDVGARNRPGRRRPVRAPCRAACRPRQAA